MRLGRLRGQPAGAATAAGPYYANPSWDQQLPASTRFVVLSNWIDAAHPSGGAAVLDRETGLVWEQSPSTAVFTWGQAQFHCNGGDLISPSRPGVRAGNRLGWRLPTLQELASLADPSVAFPGPALPAGHPFTNVQSSFYWSATTRSDANSEALGVFFDSSDVSAFTKDAFAFVAWCVRGGQGVDPQ